jgi:hypothetical protein
MKNFYNRAALLTAGGLLLTALLMPGLLIAQNRYLPPTVQDCLGAIPVCQPVYTTTNSYVGHGNVYPEIHNTGVCPLCMDGEKNDVFYIITVQTSGLLRFVLTPNNLNNDYDWSVFNMTNSDCSQLYSNATQLQVSCNSYGVLGYNGPTGISTTLGNNSNCNGPGTTNGPAFNKDLSVLAGQTYLINISNWSSTQQSGYMLDFSSSTATIYDTVPPAIDSVQELVPCSGSHDLFVRFTENMKCESVYNHPEKFSLTGPSGNISITAVTSSDCALGAPQSPNFVLTTGSVLLGGNYTLSIIGDLTDLCDNVAIYESFPFTLTEINAPVVGAGNDTTVNNGAIITLHGSATGGTGPRNFHWEPAALLINPDVQSPTTINMGATTQFVLTVTDSVGCDGTDEVLVSVVGGPLGVTATASPGTICYGTSAVLNAVPTGGSGNYSYTWSSNPAGFNSNLQNPTVFPTVTTTYTVVIADGFSTYSSSTTVNVNPLPVANAGPDQTMPYGATVYLTGNATGGSGGYSYVWTSNPSGFYSTSQNPVIINLTATTAYLLRASDLQTSCESPQDEVIVTVTGSPLNLNPITTNAVLCVGGSTQLFAMAGGGSGNYTYSWSSVPAGFSSTQVNPVITPVNTATYYVTVSDGYNLANGNVSVIVNPVPLIHLGPADTTVCIYDTLVLDAGNPGCNYYWSNGATTQTIEVGTTGIGFDVQTYTVHVINPFACTDSATITVSFSFAACTGTEEQVGDARVRIFPNPNQGNFTVSIDKLNEELVMTVENLTGQPAFSSKVKPAPAGRTEINVDLSLLPKGIYIVRLKGAGTTAIKKMIIK